MWGSGIFLLFLCPLWLFYLGLGSGIIYYIIGTTHLVYYLLFYLSQPVGNWCSNLCCTGFLPYGLILLPWADAQTCSSIKLHLSGPCRHWSRSSINICSLQRVIFPRYWFFQPIPPAGANLLWSSISMVFYLAGWWSPLYFEWHFHQASGLKYIWTWWLHYRLHHMKSRYTQEICL